jgi:hypothetical protein
MLSAEGPCLAVGDLNGDKLDDIYAGNGNGFPGALFTQQQDGSFKELAQPVFVNDAAFEDCGSVIEDIDRDGDNDLLIISGGNAEYPNSELYKTRLYINDGKGGLSKAASFPDIRINAGAVLALDYDADGDKDFLIAARCEPGRFPTAPRSYLLKNDQGKFMDVTDQVFPALKDLGMIADLESADLDKDGKPEIVFVGEWLPVSVFSFDGQSFKNQTKQYGLDKTEGWWKAVNIDDIDGDGDLDILAGNLGKNHRMVATSEEPITLITKDYDGNGSLDPILCYYYQHKIYPFAGRDAIISQIPVLKKKFLRYKPYANATIQDIFSESDLKASTYHYARTFETTYFRNDNHKFSAVPLPYQVQLHPVFDMLTFDANGDGKKDLLLAGNYLYAEPETGEIDAVNGTLLLQNADGSFSFVNNRDHGLWVTGEVRELELLKTAAGKEAIVTGNNRGPIEIHLLNR